MTLPEELKALAEFTADFLNCPEHCWCAYQPEDYPQWGTIIELMKTAEHKHGNSDTCTGCMLQDGRAQIT